MGVMVGRLVVGRAEVEVEDPGAEEEYLVPVNMVQGLRWIYYNN